MRSNLIDKITEPKYLLVLYATIMTCTTIYLTKDSKYKDFKNHTEIKIKREDLLAEISNNRRYF